MHRPPAQPAHSKHAPGPVGLLGLREGLAHRNLVGEAASSGRIRAQIVTAGTAPLRCADKQLQEPSFHMVLMLNGWARFTVDGLDTLATAGDCLHHRPGTVRTLREHSADVEYLEVVGPPERQSGRAAS